MAVSKSKAPLNRAAKPRKATSKAVSRPKANAGPEKPRAKPKSKSMPKSKSKSKSKSKAVGLATEPTLPAKVKTKLVRDSFTIPKNEYMVLDTLKARALHLACPAKKSEILRAGIKVLSALPDPALFAAIGAVPNLRTGRPKKDE